VSVVRWTLYFAVSAVGLGIWVAFEFDWALLLAVIVNAIMVPVTIWHNRYMKKLELRKQELDREYEKLLRQRDRLNTRVEFYNRGHG